MSWLYNIFIVMIVTGFALWGDTFLKAATTTQGIKQISNLGIGALIYALVAFGFYYMYKRMEFSDTGVMYSMITIVFSVLIGALLYKETINPYEWIGIILAIISVFLLSRFA